MGIQINVGDHASPEPGFVAIPVKNRAVLQWARARAKAIARNKPGANRYFASLPAGRTLMQLLNDSSVWINFEPSASDFGGTGKSFPTEIGMGPLAFRVGRWTVLATLIHELAHVGGAPSGSDQRAERALLHCGLGHWSEYLSGHDDPGTPFDPAIQG